MCQGWRRLVWILMLLLVLIAMCRRRSSWSIILNISAFDCRVRYLGANIDWMSIRIVIHAIRLWSNSNSQPHVIMANTMLHLLRLHHALANGMCRLRRSMTWC